MASTAPPDRAKRTACQIFDELRKDRSKIFLLDGGTGEELFARGLPDDRKIWSAKAVVDGQYHQLLRKVHQSFQEAGSRAITTNSYGIVPGVGFSVDEIKQHCATAARLGREAVGETDCLVLGSLGPLVESYRPDLTMKHEDGVAVYIAMIESMQQNVDCFLAETMSSVEESMQAVDAVSKSTLDMPRLMVSCTLQHDACLRSGESVVKAIQRILKFAKEKHVEGTSSSERVRLRWMLNLALKYTLTLVRVLSSTKSLRFSLIAPNLKLSPTHSNHCKKNPSSTVSLSGRMPTGLLQ